MPVLFLNTPSPFITIPHPARCVTCRTTPSCILSQPVQRAAIAVALPALPIVTYSEYVLFTTGCGLPPGPSGILGAAEGVSYLFVGAIVLASVYSKITTGKGLPDGPSKLLGAVEGICYLLVILGAAAAGYTSYKYGDLPNAVPSAGSRCFPSESL